MTFELLRWYVEERLEDERTERTTERSYCSGSAWTLASLLTGQGGGGEGVARKAFLSCLLSGQSHFAPGQQQEKVPH